MPSIANPNAVTMPSISTPNHDDKKKKIEGSHQAKIVSSTVSTNKSSKKSIFCANDLRTRSAEGAIFSLTGGGISGAGKESIPLVPPKTKKKKKKDEDYLSSTETSASSLFNATTAAALPNLFRVGIRTLFGVTVTLYILNQTHNLPRPISAMVSKYLFWPTLPITASRRIGKWSTQIDDTVVLGGAPFGFIDYPERLYNNGVRGVINMCEEYGGPQKKYDQMGIRQLRLPTTDHFVPSVDDLKTAVAFIKEHEAQGHRVYVHCRAGHGRSAAAVFAWLLYKDPIVNPEELNDNLCKLRHVRSTLWKQPNIKEYHSFLKNGGTFGGSSWNDSKSLRKALGLENDEEVDSDEDLYIKDIGKEDIIDDGNDDAGEESVHSSLAKQKENEKDFKMPQD